ncbi:MAG: flippase-like domain-containing protein, partial [Rubrobacteraceae bacterium]
PLVFVVGDWGASIATLWFCFAALGQPVSPGILIAGFAVGVTVGMLSMVPGGLGVQEGSMAATYALFGVPLGQAALAAVLFRLVYYIVPFLVSLAFYRRLLREVGGPPDQPIAERRNSPSNS